jgi:hypothetical protein
MNTRNQSIVILAIVVSACFAILGTMYQSAQPAENVSAASAHVTRERKQADPVSRRVLSVYKPAENAPAVHCMGTAVTTSTFVRYCVVDGPTVPSSPVVTITENKRTQETESTVTQPTTETPAVDDVPTVTIDDGGETVPTVDEPSEPSDPAPAVDGNPGNTKPVGNAGENPNGRGTMPLDNAGGNGNGEHGNQGNGGNSH